ncbi:MAG: hypothetical protein JRH03_17470, partial [Deltaproteobacteria bacterium]|nr:hypothetical protein [Deltaproteobacteria bacterium]
RGHFDEVEMIVIQDTAARTNALKTGAIHLMSDADVKTVHLLDKVPGIHSLKATGTFHNTIPMLLDVPPFDNNDVRLGLKYAIDREQLVKIVLNGYGTVGNDHPVAPITQFYNKDLPQRQYDPDKAKFHLKKAGMWAILPTPPSFTANRPKKPASTSRWSITRQTATGMWSGSRSPGACATGTGASQWTGCWPLPTPAMPSGMTPTLSMPVSTSFSWKPERNWMKRNVRKCTTNARPSCTTRAAWWYPSLQTG